VLTNNAIPKVREGQYVRLLDIEPDLGADLTADEHEQARRLAVAPAVDLPPGPIDLGALLSIASRRGPVFALIVARGVIIRDIHLAGRTATQLLGPGDVIDVRECPREMLPAEQELTAAAGVRIALADDRFLAASRRWPWLAARLIERTGRQVERGAVQQAISQLGRVELRLIGVMCHLAERFGRMTSSGVVITLDLTHEALGRLAGAARPTVTLALKDLAAAGWLTRRKDGAWLLDRNSHLLLAQDGVDGQRERVTRFPTLDTLFNEAGPRDPTSPPGGALSRRHDVVEGAATPS
jgi:CRP/FNR family cyclic AMP-dependent transcriptional regulator